MVARSSTPPARETRSPSPFQFTPPARATAQLTPRRAAAEEAAAQAFGRQVFEDTSRDSSLEKFHERAREAGPGRPGVLERAYAQPEHRQELLELLVNRWDEASLGLRDDWLVTTMWTLDRVRLRKRVDADLRSPGCRSSDSWDAQERDLWAAALMVLKMSEAETQLDRNMKSVVVRLARSSLQAQRPGWPVDRASIQRMWDDISRHEMAALRALEWRTATPSPPDLLAWLATDLTSSAQLPGMWKLHKPLAGHARQSHASHQTLELALDGTVVLREVADPSAEGVAGGTSAPPLELRRGKLRPARGACGACPGGELPEEDGFVQEIHWQQADCAPLLVKLHTPAGAPGAALPELLLRPRGPAGSADAARAERTEQAPSSAWQGLPMGRVHDTREPLPGQPQSPSCSNPLYPRFVLLAQYLVQLGLVYAPLEEIYGEEVPPAALPLAALRLALGAFGAPPPEPCATRLEELLGRLLRPAEALRLPRLEACLHRLWSEPGGGAVARLWRRRAGCTGLDVGHGPKPGPLPWRRPQGACLRCAALTPETPRSKGTDAQMATPAKGAALQEAVEAQPLGAALPPKSGLRRLRPSLRCQPADTEEDKENVCQNVPPGRGTGSLAAAAPPTTPPADRAEGPPLGARPGQQPGALGTPPTGSRSPRREAGGASDGTSPSIFSRDLGSSSQRQSAIYEDAPTSEGASQRSPGGGHEEGEPVVVSVSLPVGLDEFSQAPRQPMGEIQVGQTAALGTPKQPEDGLDRGRAAAAAAARQHPQQQQRPQPAEGPPPSPPGEERLPAAAALAPASTARAVGCPLGAAPAAAAGAPVAPECHGAPRGTPAEPGAKRQGSRLPGGGPLGTKRQRLGGAMAPFPPQRPPKRAAQKKPAAAAQESAQERPADARELAEERAWRLAAALPGALLVSQAPRQADVAADFMQQYNKDPGHRVPLHAIIKEAEADGAAAAAPLRAAPALARRAPPRRAPVRARLPPGAARAAAAPAATAPILGARAALASLAHGKAPRAAAPAAAARRQRSAGSQPARAAIPEGAFDAKWWDGKWTVVCNDGPSDGTIDVKNMQFSYSGFPWRIQTEGTSIFMRWPHNPEVIQRMKYAADRNEVMWEASSGSREFGFFLWQKDVPKTRSTGIVLGGKGWRDVPVQGGRSRVSSKRSLEAPPPPVAAHPAGAPGARRAPEAEAAAARLQEARRTKSGRCSGAPHEGAGRPWPATAAGTY